MGHRDPQVRVTVTRGHGSLLLVMMSHGDLQ